MNMITLGFGSGGESSKVLDGAENGVNVGEIGNVVTEIGHRRFEDGRQPQNVDAQFDEMVQPVGDSYVAIDN